MQYKWSAAGRHPSSSEAKGSDFTARLAGGYYTPGGGPPTRWKWSSDGRAGEDGEGGAVLGSARSTQEGLRVAVREGSDESRASVKSRRSQRGGKGQTAATWDGYLQE